MALFKKLSELKTELQTWEIHKPVNNMGKWARQIRLDSIQKQIDKIENELKKKQLIKTKTK